MDYNLDNLVEKPYRYASEHFSESLDEMKFIRQAIAHVNEVFQLAETHPLRYRAVHLDIWYDNFNVQESTITLFDFDFCGNGWLLLDIAYFCMQLFHTEPEKAAFERKRQRFLEGYRTHASIGPEEEQLIPIAGLAIWIFYLGVQSRRFNDWSNIFLTENYLKHYGDLVKSWLAYHDLQIESN